MGQILRLDSSGHGVAAKWGSDKAEIKSAAAVFAELQSQGFTMFRTAPDGAETVKLKEFDPAAETTIAVPRLIGG
jgi:hypothetical protein